MNLINIRRTYLNKGLIEYCQYKTDSQTEKNILLVERIIYFPFKSE